MKQMWMVWMAAALGVAGCSGRGPESPAEADLVAAVESIAAGEPFPVAFRLQLSKPWHAYWINPGDSGLAPALTWLLPEGFTASELEFPAPVAISTPPFMTYGLEGDVWLLATVTPPAVLPAGPVTLSAEAEWLICNDVCVPGYAELSLTVPVREGPATPHPVYAAKIASARERLPYSPPGWTFRAQQTSDRYLLWATPPPAFSGDIPSATFFPSDPERIRHAAPQVWRREGTDFVLELVPDVPAAPPPENLSGVLAGDLPDSRRPFLIEAPFSEAGLPRTSTTERTLP